MQYDISMQIEETILGSNLAFRRIYYAFDVKFMSQMSIPNLLESLSLVVVKRFDMVKSHPTTTKKMNKYQKK